MTEALARQLVALSPSELTTAQHGLRDWCQQKILALSRELREQRENLRIAKRAKWKHSGWLNQIGRTKARMIYYTKIRHAIEAGYLLVPNFDVDIIALRVARDKPSDTVASNPRTVHETKGQILPPGEGRYVDEEQEYLDISEDVPDPKIPGKTIHKPAYFATGYQDFDFPVKAVKPQILAATQRAMALKLFDQIGIARGSDRRGRKDPIVLGRIGRPGRFHMWHHFEGATFFIAWWIDPEDL